MKVIKLGGSLLKNDSLLACLARITATQEQCIVVSGGGAFADQVRLSQQRWQFNDVAAHQMAILAMQQMTVLINALQPDWVLLQSLTDLQQFPTQNRTGLWFPDLALLNQHAIPASWRVTSDSLAAWLAGMTAATELIIIKAAQFSKSLSQAELIAQGVLDAAFLDYVNPACYQTTIINSHDFINKI